MLSLITSSEDPTRISLTSEGTPLHYSNLSLPNRLRTCPRHPKVFVASLIRTDSIQACSRQPGQRQTERPELRIVLYGYFLRFGDVDRVTAFIDKPHADVYILGSQVGPPCFSSRGNLGCGLLSLSPFLVSRRLPGFHHA